MYCALAGSAPGDNLWLSIRNALIQIDSTPGGGPFSLAMNLPEIATGVAFVAVCLRIRNGCSWLLETVAICVALLYQVLTAARYGVFLLMLCIIVLRAMAPGASWRRMMRTVMPFVLAFAVLFFVNQITLAKGVDKTYNTLANNIDLVGHEVVVHAVGGLVGFDQVVANPEVVVPNQEITVFFKHTLNKLSGPSSRILRNFGPAPRSLAHLLHQCLHHLFLFLAPLRYGGNHGANVLPGLVCQVVLPEIPFRPRCVRHSLCAHDQRAGDERNGR